MPDERTWTVRERCADGSVRHVAVVEKSRLVALEAELTQRERERDEYQRRMVDALDSMEAHRANHNEAVERLGRAAAVLALIGTLGDVDADEAPSLARRVLAELESVEAGEKKRNTTNPDEEWPEGSGPMGF